MSVISIHEFADKLNEIMPEIVRGMIKRQADELFQGKITLPQFFLLNYLKKEGQLNMSAIARFLGVTTAAATGVVDRLVRGGYMVRVNDPDDRRIIKVKLSSRGNDVVEKIQQERRKSILEAFGKISAEERQQYLSILTKVNQIMKENNGSGDNHA